MTMTRSSPERGAHQTRTLAGNFAVREEGEEKRLEGYFAVFGDTYELWPGATESIDPHAFDGALADDIRALIDHESRLVLGRTSAGTLRLSVDGKGLWGSILINPDDQDAVSLYARVQRGDVSQCSFGFDILEEETTETKGPDGQWLVHWTIRKVKLYEVSVVTFPAYKDTEISARQEDYKVIRHRQMEIKKKNLLDRLHGLTQQEKEDDGDA